MKQIRDTQYLISEDGKIFNSKTKKFLKGSLDKDGYRRFSLNGFNASVHRMIMETYKPVENMEKLEVNHIDGNKLNNTLENLEWCTREENMAHLVSSGLSSKCSMKGSKNGRAKLDEDKVREIKKLLKEGLSLSEIGAIYGVGKTTISDIKNGKRWKHVQE
ncbi:MAG: HNH endonuclease [Clostridia bacterium]|nr:HNH endonuclease [Clostridia bacterium]